MLFVGVIKPESHLSALLDRVAQDEEGSITRRQRAIARSLPLADEASRWAGAAEEALGLGTMPTGVTLLRSLIDQGGK